MIGYDKKVDLAGIDVFAGFGVKISTLGGELRLLGERSIAGADVYVCQTKTGDLVIIFVDKVDLHHHGGIELLRMHYLNFTNQRGIRKDFKVTVWRRALSSSCSTCT
jgi:hypothetical protein